MNTPSQSQPRATGEVAPLDMVRFRDKMLDLAGDDYFTIDQTMFIIHACNSHAALVAALEMAHAQFNSIVSAMAQGHTVSIGSVQNCAAVASAALNAASK